MQYSKATTSGWWCTRSIPTTPPPIRKWGCSGTPKRKQPTRQTTNTCAPCARPATGTSRRPAKWAGISMPWRTYSPSPTRPISSSSTTPTTTDPTTLVYHHQGRRRHCVVAPFHRTKPLPPASPHVNVKEVLVPGPPLICQGLGESPGFFSSQLNDLEPPGPACPE